MISKRVRDSLVGAPEKSGYHAGHKVKMLHILSFYIILLFKQTKSIKASILIVFFSKILSNNVNIHFIESAIISIIALHFKLKWNNKCLSISYYEGLFRRMDTLHLISIPHIIIV